jgi:hypothetical protein
MPAWPKAFHPSGGVGAAMKPPLTSLFSYYLILLLLVRGCCFSLMDRELENTGAPRPAEIAPGSADDAPGPVEIAPGCPENATRPADLPPDMRGSAVIRLVA